MKNDLTPVDAGQTGRAFDTAHESAVQANHSAGGDTAVRRKLDEQCSQAAEMDKRLPMQLMYLFSLLFVGVCIAECLASWEAYKLFLPGGYILFGLRIPYALFAVLAIVSASIYIAHLLRTMSQPVAAYEDWKAENENPGLPLSALRRQIAQRRRLDRARGLFALLLLSGVLLGASYVRVKEQGLAEGVADLPFTIMDVSPVIFLLIETALGIFLFYTVQRLSLAWSIFRLKSKSAKLRSICQEQTHLVAAAVFDLDRYHFDWSGDNEIRIAMLRYEHHNSAEDSYTDPIQLGKTSVLVRDKNGKAVQSAQVMGLTVSDMLTHPAVTGLNGEAVLNYMDHSLKAILVSGQTFEGEYRSGGTAVIVVEPPRSIGF